jgi:hypothetical protein
MQPGNKYHLREDIFPVAGKISRCKIPYGRKHDEVIIIAIRGHVLIVENIFRERFPVKASKVIQ